MCKTVGKQLASRKSQTDKYLIQMRAAFTLSSVYYREYITYGDLTSSALSSLSTMPLFFFFTNAGKHLATWKRQYRQIVDTDSRSGYSFGSVNYKEYRTLLMSIQPSCTFCRNHFLLTFNNFFCKCRETCGHQEKARRKDGDT